ncbi:MAG: hypothetical protein ACLFU3_08735 [Dichotomicrobium sp.]
MPPLPSVSEWSVYKNERFGYRLVYPQSWFEPGPVSPNGDGRAFTTPEGDARIVVFGAHNGERMSLREYRATLLEEYGDYEELTYSPIGDTWFVLSGYSGDTIYYQKVMFSCGGRIINVLSISFPAEDKPQFSPMIEEAEDRFRPGQGEDTPRDC